MQEPTERKALLPRMSFVPLLLAMMLVPAAALHGAAPSVEAQATADATSGIRINQLGFLPTARKLAIVESATARSFAIVRADNGREVLQGELQPAATWALAQRPATVADLSALTSPGSYRVIVEGLAPSDPFPIHANAYAAVGDAALKAYYFQRASTELAAQHAGIYARKAGHPDTEVEVHASAASATRPAGTVISAPRGWYDAGDYNKYIVNSGISTWTLLAALDHFPAFWQQRDINIPESGDAVPDLLDEARWNLLWMLDMQDPADGGVYHKLTTLRFDGMEMPERDTARRYVVQKATAATLDFAAVMAMASRLHAPYEQQFPGAAARMRKAAEAAWGWAKANPAVAYQQPRDVVTGAYGDRRFDDEFAWAGAELFLLTGDAGYLREVTARTAPAVVPSWSDVGTLGLISLVRHREKLPADARRQVEEQLLVLADKLSTQWQASPWKVAMQASDMVWGSNAVVLNQALVLLQGYWQSGQRDYLDAAQSQLDYILGRNPLGVSFVTGHGLRTPRHIHHRPSEADGIDAPIPGLLSGGPNPGRQDARDCPVQYASAVAALAWLDHNCSYASNEIAINWNAPLVYVTAALQQRAAALTRPQGVADLPIRNEMPDPLVMNDGTRVTSAAQWRTRRQEMIRVLEDSTYGHMPPPPGNVQASVVVAPRRVGNADYRMLRLAFGPERKLGFDLGLFTPANARPAAGKFPVLVMLTTGAGERSLAAAAAALERGYAVATVPYQQLGADSPNWQTTGFFAAYPDYDWRDFSAWAWGLSRAVDYLVTDPAIDATKIMISGVSRLGQAVLLAGALDERVALTAPVAGGMALRFSGKEMGGGLGQGITEVVDQNTYWFGPRFAEFRNQTPRLPSDQHWLPALTAPRLFILCNSLADQYGRAYAAVQTYRGAKPVYELLGVPANLGLNFRPGGHGMNAEDWSALLDFADQKLLGKPGTRRFDAPPPRDATP